MTYLAPHAHVVVSTAQEEVVLVRRVRNGRVYYLAPGVAVSEGETPGAAATRAARDELGIEVATQEMLHAEAFGGADHFFFSAKPLSGFGGDVNNHVHGDFELDAERDGSSEVAGLRISTLLAYDVRPWALALRLARGS